MAIDSMDNSETTTNVDIRIVAKTDNIIRCNTDYLLIKVSDKSDCNHFNFNINISVIFYLIAIEQGNSFSTIGDLTCLSSSYFSDPSFQYSIGVTLAIYDCNGFEINYEPNIGIASTNGTIFSFEELTRKKFCDAFYIINVFKDQTGIFSTKFFRQIILNN